MNRNEFLEYLSQHLPPTLGKVTPEHLKRWEDFGVLCPRPEYYLEDIHIVMGLCKWRTNRKSKPLTRYRTAKASVDLLPIRDYLPGSVIPLRGYKRSRNERESHHKAGFG